MRGGASGSWLAVIESASIGNPTFLDVPRRSPSLPLATRFARRAFGA
jgi:hypothetical protein